MPTRASMYAIRIKGQLGATALSAFPSMAYQLIGGETVLTGWLEDRSACLAFSRRSKESASSCWESDKSGRVHGPLNQATSAD